MKAFILIQLDGTRQEVPFLSGPKGQPYISKYISAAEFGEHDDKGIWIPGIQIIAYKPVLDIHTVVREQIGPWVVNSGYRSDTKQQKMWDAEIARVRLAHPNWTPAQIEKEANKLVAHPGSSPHRTGAAVDAAIPKGRTAKEMAGRVIAASKNLGYGVARTGWVDYHGQWLHFDIVYRLFLPYPGAHKPNPAPVAWREGVSW